MKNSCFCGTLRKITLAGSVLCSLVIASLSSEINDPGQPAVAVGDLYVEIEADHLVLSGLSAPEQDPWSWVVWYFPDATTPFGQVVVREVSLDPDGFFTLSTGIPAGVIGPAGGIFVISSPNVPLEDGPLVIVWLGHAANEATILSPVSGEPGNLIPAGDPTILAAEPKPYRMRLQLQQGKATPWSKAIEKEKPVTVAEINGLLDQMLADYKAGKIEGIPRDKETTRALEGAIAQMQKDLAKIPPNGVSGSGNVKRKKFKDSAEKEWRIDLENLAGKNLVE
jgi:hypothetical protein